MNKYTSHHQTSEGPAAALTIGKLSVFLSTCLCGEIQCSSEEKEALAVLLQASNDQQLCFADGEVGGVLAALSSPSLHRPTLSRRYWASRVYNFLSKVIELKSTVIDPKALDALPI
mmetsp:Transcript_31435/g.42931  ORF Transcript_31435/g.42931 Transcript_31435/m.42931 type:complete len:116 (-) Transcript_31435:152-499(-)